MRQTFVWCGAFRTLGLRHRSASHIEKQKQISGAEPIRENRIWTPGTPGNPVLKTQKRDPFCVRNFFFASGVFGASLPLSEHRPMSALGPKQTTPKSGHQLSALGSLCAIRRIGGVTHLIVRDTRCLLYPRKRSWFGTIVMSARCQKQTSIESRSCPLCAM